MKAVRTVDCPTCGTASPWTPANRFRPFCSERCKGIDLGHWADESYRVPAIEPPDEFPGAPGETPQ